MLCMCTRQEIKLNALSTLLIQNVLHNVITYMQTWRIKVRAKKSPACFPFFMDAVNTSFFVCAWIETIVQIFQGQQYEKTGVDMYVGS